MELTHLNQIYLDEIRSEKVDCLIATAGTQSRCLFLAESLLTVASKKILLTTGNEEQKQTGKYLPAFSDYGFIRYSASFSDPKNVDRLFHEICNVNACQLNIIIDYSCMPKKWYALFIDCITRNTYPVERINLYLSYTPKIFERNPGKHVIDYFGPIIFNRDKLKDKKPVSMIVSLDHNHNSVLEAVNKVKPQKLIAFIPHCTHDPEYTRLVRENNRHLLEKIDQNDIIGYEADRPEEINSLLTSRCLDERVDSEVVIVPQGPKTFSIMSMLLSVRYPDIKLWEIIFKDRKINPEHGNPAANPVIVKVSFINDELD
jgi:hypothetical protein